MTFVEGFLTPVPIANKARYLEHAREAVPLFRSLGATRFVESWGDDVPDGKLNDLKQAVQAAPEEAVLQCSRYPDSPALTNPSCPVRLDKLTFGLLCCNATCVFLATQPL